MITNYARHIETKAVIFLDEGDIPAGLEGELEKWAFYAVPDGHRRTQFQGNLIGEDQEQRCRRLLHAPRAKACLACSAVSELGT